MQPFDWSGWTDWHDLESLDYALVPVNPGAYAISTGQSIGRLAGIDEDGYLDIGESGNLRRRLADFHRCAVTRGSYGHNAGWLFAYLRIDRQVPVSCLRVRWKQTPTKRDAYREECLLMAEYLRKYRELPPLNNKFNWSGLEESGWKDFEESF